MPRSTCASAACSLREHDSRATRRASVRCGEPVQSGRRTLIDRDEKAQVAAIDLRAGRKRQGIDGLCVGAAHISAAGMALLDEADWEQPVRVDVRPWLERAECEFLTGDFDTAEQLIGELLQRAPSKVDRAAVYLLKISTLYREGTERASRRQRARLPAPVRH